MIRWLVALLLVVNLGLLLYGSLGLQSDGQEKALLARKPDVGSIRLLAAGGNRLPVPAKAAPPVEPVAGLTEQNELVGGGDALHEDLTAIPESPLVQAGAGDEPVAERQPAAESSTPHQQPATGLEPAEPGPPEPPVLAAESEPEPAETTALPADPEQDLTGSDEQQPVVGEGSVATEPEESQRYCAEAGPFKKKSQARAIGARLGNAVQAEVVSRKYDEITGYWVLIPPLPDRRQAKETVARLKEAGVEDLWLFSKGEKRNAISLGLYSRQDAAREHADTIRSKGFGPEVRPSTRRATGHWLVVTGLDQQALENLQQHPLPSTAVLEKKVCPQSSVDD